MSGGTITVNACAKLNLYLDITGRREDGYHLLETVMQSVTLSDTVTVTLYECGRGITVSCSNPRIPTDERNICYKASRLFMDEIGVCAGADIAIEKRIPSGAGMGGGSADAAAVLAGLNELYGKPLDSAALSRIAAMVGADVPFCLEGGTKICRGIGEEISETNMVTDCCFLVVMPEFTCPTGEAYSRYDLAPLPPKNGLEDFTAAGGEFHGQMYNVFEELYADERIAEIRREMLDAGALGAMLTGSGAAVFGVFAEEETAIAAAKRFPTLFVTVCEPSPRGIILI